MIAPYGTGSNNNTFSLRVIGWRIVGETGDQTFTSLLWWPVTLCELACTLSATTGVAGRIISNTERAVDTIVLTTGNANVNNSIVSPADDTIAHCTIDLEGFQKIEYTFDTGSSATDCNLLWALI